jgi:cell division transport system permease protein
VNELHLPSLAAMYEVHRQSAVRSYYDLLRRPWATLMTLLVISITLALPASMLSLLKVSNVFTGDRQPTASMSLFLKQGIVDEKALTLATTLEEKNEVNRVELLTSADALEEFREYSGFGSALDALEENPLPNVLLVHLNPEVDAVQLKNLAGELASLPVTDSLDYDQGWVERLQMISQAARRTVQAIGFGLALAVMLIIGNTIRLEIMNRREEIEVTRLVGGSNGYIRRPFLYTGAGYGLAGAFLAWLMVSLLMLIIRPPLARLAELYDTELSIALFGFQALLWLIPVGLILGLGGAWLAVGRHLSKIRPE